MLQHVMLDLETWGTAPYSTIILIGACAFDPHTVREDKIIQDRFEVAIDPRQQGLIDPDTILRWMSPDRDEARREWLKHFEHGASVATLPLALDGFTDWLRTFGESEDLRIWGNGSDFDNALLIQAYKTTKRDVPWSYRHNRCFRTLRSLATLEEGVYLGTAHTALADAENQARRANQIVRHLEIKLT